MFGREAHRFLVRPKRIDAGKAEIALDRYNLLAINADLYGPMLLFLGLAHCRFPFCTRSTLGWRMSPPWLR
ncbi:hypothetical protein D3C80_1726900 [compost metagenome]